MTIEVNLPTASAAATTLAGVAWWLWRVSAKVTRVLTTVERIESRVGMNGTDGALQTKEAARTAQAEILGVLGRHGEALKAHREELDTHHDRLLTIEQTRRS